MIRYAVFQNFLWLWLVPVMAAVAVYGIWQRRRAVATFVGASSVNRLASEIGLARIWMKAACMVSAVALVVFSLAQPQWGKHWTQARASGRDIMVALDVSRSMLADDVTPNRLERAKADVRDLVAAVEESGGHRLGLIAFAGAPSLKCPLTQVTSHFKLVLDGLDTRSVARGGTMIGDCIREAIEAFDDETQNQNFRDLILITDGEDMDSFPLEAAAAAKEAGITITTIGLGDSDQGARIPVADSSGQRSYLEHEGEIVWSKLEEGPLRQIAEITGGIYVPAGTRAIELDRIFRDVIEPKTKRELDETRRERLQHRFQWFLAPAVLLLMIESLMHESRRRPTPSPQPSPPEGRGSQTGRGPSRGRQSVLPAAETTYHSPLTSHPVAVLVVTSLFLMSATPADDAGSFVREGNRLYAQGKFAEAADRYERAAKLEPESAVPLFNQASALFQAGEFDRAAKLYERARVHASDDLRQQINYALGNCHLQQAIGSQSQPAPASQSAKTATKFYRDAISLSARSPASAAVSDAAKHNLELANRLRKLLEQKQQPQPEQQRDDEKKQDDKPDEKQQDQKPGQEPRSENQQSAPDSGQDPSQSQPEPSDGTEQQSQRIRGTAKEQLTPDEAGDRLRAAIARAHMARQRRLSEQAKQARGKGVERDW
jgi:Ca-activated chloride channel family protein